MPKLVNGEILHLEKIGDFAHDQLSVIGIDVDCSFIVVILAHFLSHRIFINKRIIAYVIIISAFGNQVKKANKYREYD